MISNLLNTKNAVVVGGTNGIGKGIAYSLAKNGANVIICGRSKEASEEILKDLSEINPNAKHTAILGDLTLQSEVARITDKVKEEYNHLDYLVLTQGNPQLNRDLTSEGIDKKLSLHYYSRMNFIHKLTPLLSGGSDTPSYVVSVLSGGVHSAFTDMSNIGLEKSYNVSNSANAPGFYNDLILDKFAKANRNAYYFHVAPGVVNTNYGTTFPFPLNYITKAALKLMGNDLYSAGDKFVKNVLLNDKYKPLPSSNPAIDNFILTNFDHKTSPRLKEHTEEIQEKVWQHTKELLKWE